MERQIARERALLLSHDRMEDYGRCLAVPSVRGSAFKGKLSASLPEALTGSQESTVTRRQRPLFGESLPNFRAGCTRPYRPHLLEHTAIAREIQPLLTRGYDRRSGVSVHSCDAFCCSGRTRRGVWWALIDTLHFDRKGDDQILGNILGSFKTWKGSYIIEQSCIVRGLFANF